jgi:DNA-binding transcriptional regulator YiaG
MAGKKEKVMREFLKERLKDPDYRKFHEEEKFRTLLGNEIAAARKKAKLSVPVLASRAGVPEKAISNIERGEHKKLTWKILMEISNALKMRLKVQYVPWTDD